MGVQAAPRQAHTTVTTQLASKPLGRSARHRWTAWLTITLTTTGADGGGRTRTIGPRSAAFLRSKRTRADGTEHNLLGLKNPVSAVRSRQVAPGSSDHNRRQNEHAPLRTGIQPIKQRSSDGLSEPRLDHGCVVGKKRLP